MIRWVLVGLAVGAMACGERAAEERRVPGPDTTAASARAPDAGGTLAWTNDRSRLAGDKLANFVPFAFRYPASWRVVEDGAGDTPNFVKVENATESGITIENFAVGWYAGTGADEVAAAIEPRFAASFPNYVKIADETAMIGGAASRGFRFQAVVETQGGPLTFFGRVIARPVEPARGLLMVMFASQLAPGIESAGDLGQEGELPVILESFEVGDR